MSGPAFMQMYWSDYFGDTRHLTCEQHGAYLQLLGSMWLSGGTLPNDPKKLAKVTGCTPSRWAKICAEVMAFFTVDGDGLTHKRIKFELEKAREKSIKRAEVGSLGGKAKSLKNKEPDLAIATDLPGHTCALPDTRYQNSSVEDKSSTALVVDLDPDRDAWSQGPELLMAHHRLSTDQAKKIFGRLLSENQIRARELLPAIGQAKANGTNDPRSYLTKAAQGVRRRREAEAAPKVERRVSWV
jgi:uncharacterized protein YdaU (DUF1376 family)